MVYSFIHSIEELETICDTDAKNAIIECQVGNDMPLSWHNAIAEHNSKVKGSDFITVGLN
jgi:hypothetical protein